MTDDKQKPDRWVAWHPEKGKMREAFSRSGCVEQMLVDLCLLEPWPSNYARADQFFLATEIAEAKALKDGWRVRPVKLVFLDEEK